MTRTKDKAPPPQDPTTEISGPVELGNTVLSRRQLGLLFGGGAAVIIGGASFGVVAKSAEHSRINASTAFGSIRLLRAARLARLAADGTPSPLAGQAALDRLSGDTVTAGGGGSVIPVAAAGHGGHSGGAIPGVRWPQPENHTFGDVILLEFEAHNTSTEPMLFSAGQLRLRTAGSTGSTSHQDAGRDPGALQPGATERLWVSFLTAETAAGFRVEFDDPIQDTTVELRLPELVTVMERS